jgi:xanthine dehydrogenase YagS FAD-binding subunit
VTDQLLAGAKTTSENAFKLTLVERALGSTLTQARV